MSGLIDAVAEAIAANTEIGNEDARAAVLAVADWLDAETGGGGWAVRLRAEVAPPPPPTAEDVIRRYLSHPTAVALIRDLGDAGLLKEPYTEQSESSW